MSEHRRCPGFGPNNAPKEALVQAAIAVFSEHKLSEVRIADIAERAGMSKANVYNHFRDKDQLFLAAHRRLVLVQLHQLGAEVEQQEDMPSKLGVLARDIQAAAGHPLRRLPPELCERALGCPDLREDLQSVRAEIHQWIRTLLRSMVGDTGHPLLEMAAPVFVSFMVMFYPLALLFEPELQQPALLAQYLEHLLRTCQS
jgi:AcrR family transcriptional regulator